MVGLGVGLGTSHNLYGRAVRAVEGREEVFDRAVAREGEEEACRHSV